MGLDFNQETFRNDFTFRNSPKAIRRFPFPFHEDGYMYSVNPEPHVPGPKGSVFEHTFDVDEHYVAEMRDRIKVMRQTLVDGLKAAGVQADMSFITKQIGMFSYSGLTKDQMVRLRNEFGVYGTDTGRMCVAAMNSQNINYICKAVAAVL